MAEGKRRGKDTLLKEYRTLGEMSRSLIAHQRKVNAIARSIAKKTSTDAGFGLIENLDIVSEHIGKADREIGRALRKLRKI